MGVAGVALTAPLIEPSASALGWIGGFDGAAVVALAVAIAALAALPLGGAVFVSLLRSYGRVLTRLEASRRRWCTADSTSTSWPCRRSPRAGRTGSGFHGAIGGR